MARVQRLVVVVPKLLLAPLLLTLHVEDLHVMLLLNPDLVILLLVLWIVLLERGIHLTPALKNVVVAHTLELVPY